MQSCIDVPFCKIYYSYITSYCIIFLNMCVFCPVKKLSSLLPISSPLYDHVVYTSMTLFDVTPTFTSIKNPISTLNDILSNGKTSLAPTLFSKYSTYRRYTMEHFSFVSQRNPPACQEPGNFVSGLALSCSCTTDNHGGGVIREGARGVLTKACKTCLNIRSPFKDG